jgi:hypothetical protein
MSTVLLLLYLLLQLDNNRAIFFIITTFVIDGGKKEKLRRASRKARSGDEESFLRPLVAGSGTQYTPSFTQKTNRKHSPSLTAPLRRTPLTKLTNTNHLLPPPAFIPTPSTKLTQGHTWSTTHKTKLKAKTQYGFKQHLPFSIIKRGCKNTGFLKGSSRTCSEIEGCGVCMHGGSISF